LSNRIHTLIVGHGSFPQGLLSAAERIVGKQEGVAAVSNHGLGTTELIEKLKKGSTETQDGVYVFIDLVGGSCFTACRELALERRGWVFIAGVNLPMLVTYLSYRNRLSADALLQKTLEAGRRGMEKFS
jgi:PTS system mannose-specific IIA component